MHDPKKGGHKMADEIGKPSDLAMNLPKHEGPAKGSAHKMADEVDKAADRMSANRRGSHILPPHMDGD